jgi:hypothetical protein
MEDNRDQAPAPAPPPVTPGPAILPPPPSAAPTTATGPLVVVEKKSPGLAGVLSAIFPGLGHLYLGLYQRAFKIAGAFVVCIWLVSVGFMGGHMAPLFGLGIAFVWFFGIIDAVRQAKAINSGYIDAGGLAASEATALRRRASESMAGLTWGVILVGIGALWLLDRYVPLDAFWAAVEDWLAPVAFIMLGLVLIVTYVAKKRRHNASEVWPPRDTT